MSLNKKLYNDNNNLIKTLELRNAEINGYKERLDEWMGKYNKMADEKMGLERTIFNLNEYKASQKVEITKFVEDIQKLSRMFQESESRIKNLEAEKTKLLSRNDELNFEVKNISGKLKSREENLNFTQRQFDEANGFNQKFQQALKDYEKEIEIQSNNISSLSLSLQKEKILRKDCEKSNEKFQIMLSDNDKEINRYANELESSRKINHRLNEEKSASNGDNEKMKNHIMLLTDQNQKVKI
jgi:hypothetical protein